MPVDARNGPAPSDAQAVPEQVEMQAVRELLFGEQQRLLDGRIQRLENQVAALERGLNDRFRELSQRFDELAQTAESQNAALRDVGRLFSALGRQLGDANGLSSGGLGGHVRKPE